jgi:hypothetical protein
MNAPRARWPLVIGVLLSVVVNGPYSLGLANGPADTLLDARQWPPPRTPRGRRPVIANGGEAARSGGAGDVPGPAGRRQACMWIRRIAENQRSFASNRQVLAPALPGRVAGAERGGSWKLLVRCLILPSGPKKMLDRFLEGPFSKSVTPRWSSLLAASIGPRACAGTKQTNDDRPAISAPPRSS